MQRVGRVSAPVEGAVVGASRQPSNIDYPLWEALRTFMAPRVELPVMAVADHSIAEDE
jgi:hypothetical protein